MQLQFFVQKQMDNITPRFRQYIKEKQFQLKDFGSYGLQNVLVVPAHQNKAVSKSPYIAILTFYDHISRYY